jgi:hypothetical protein
MLAIKRTLAGLYFKNHQIRSRSAAIRRIAIAAPDANQDNKRGNNANKAEVRGKITGKIQSVRHVLQKRERTNWTSSREAQ